MLARASCSKDAAQPHRTAILAGVSEPDSFNTYCITAARGYWHYTNLRPTVKEEFSLEQQISRETEKQNKTLAWQDGKKHIVIR